MHVVEDKTSSKNCPSRTGGWMSTSREHPSAVAYRG